MDKITLKNIELFGYHGYYQEENTLGQRFRITLEAYGDLGPAKTSGELKDSINYVEIFEEMKAIFYSKTYKLLEQLSYDMGQGILSKFNILKRVDIEIMKPEIAVPVTCDYFSIRQEYKREEQAFIALGSNLGDRLGYLESAIRQLKYCEDITVVALSSVYETEPVGYEDQGRFLNMVLEVKTALSPMELLNYCNHIEGNLLRKREVRFGPRTIDVDILLYGNLRSEDPILTLPHPRMKERGFVLMPLKDLVGDAFEVEGETIPSILGKLDTSGIELYTIPRDGQKL